MKQKIILLAGLLLTAPFALRAQECKTVVLHNSFDSLCVSITTGGLASGHVTLDGQTFATLSVDGLLSSTQVGKPSLPTFTSLIEVPLCGGFDIRVSDARFDTIDAPALPLAPVQTPRAKSDTKRYPLDIDRALYSRDAFYSEPLAQAEAVGVARDRNLARLQFSPVSYNPVSRKLVVCRQATLTVVYRDADAKGSMSLYERYHTPAFSPNASTLNKLYTKEVNNTVPVRYLIVSHSMFRGQLDSLVQWKQRKGYMVDVAYTDSSAVGTSTNSIQAFLRSQYTNATATMPAPTYVLLVGDAGQIPVFSSDEVETHVTDLYYLTWTAGDNIPDAYCGRFSAEEISHLTPQIQKTLMYEQYTFADPSFLGRAVMVAGVDGGNVGDHGYTHADPAMDYAITHYINGENGYSNVYYFKNNTDVIPTGSNVTVAPNNENEGADVRRRYNEGAGWINYSAHGGHDCWGTPRLNTSDVEAMTNSQKFGIMIGNCCLTNTFGDDTPCLGEALLRKDKYCGAVGYIGGSKETYWGEDFYWAVGLRSSISATMSLAYNASNLGAYDRSFHTHNEAQSDWVASQGALMMAGNMAVQSSNSGLKLYYWEIYHLMGDPSLMPYQRQASFIDLAVRAVIPFGVTNLQVTAVPYAFVALTDSASHTLITSAFADASGVVNFSLPGNLPVGTYEVAASAQNYRTTFRTLSVTAPPAGEPYALVNDVTSSAPIVAGQSVQLTIPVLNIGDVDADNVVVRLASDNPLVTLVRDTFNFAQIAAGQYVNGTTTLSVRPQMTDNQTFTLTAVTSWGSDGDSSIITFPLRVKAPSISVQFSRKSLNVAPSDSATILITLANQGQATLPPTHLSLSPFLASFSAVDCDTAVFSLAPGEQVTRRVRVTAASDFPEHVLTFLGVSLAGDFGHLLNESIGVYYAQRIVEDFENNAFALNGWGQGDHPWTFTTATSVSGNGSLRSDEQLSNYETSEITFTYDVQVDDSVRFSYKVSSERNYDKFYFYIDGDEMMNASGDVDWSDTAFAVSAGAHTFTFAYEKDQSVSDGDDCAWIDNVMFPPVLDTPTYQYDTVCFGSELVVDGDTVDTHTPGVISVSSGSVNYLYVVLPENRVTFAVTTQNSSYQWGDTLYTASGRYEQSFTAVNGCDSIVTLILTLNHEPEGIDNAEAVSVRAYPSPTTGMVTLSREAAVATVYDVNGRRLMTLKNARSLDLTALPAGVYTLRLQLSDGTATTRVVKQ